MTMYYTVVAYIFKMYEHGNFSELVVFLFSYGFLVIALHFSALRCNKMQTERTFWAMFGVSREKVMGI